MGIISKSAMYTTFFVLGFGVCYNSCVNKHYKIVEQDGKMYVQDRETGKRQKIDTDFKERASTDPGVGKSLAGKVEEAYKVLVK